MPDFTDCEKNPVVQQPLSALKAVPQISLKLNLLLASIGKNLATVSALLAALHGGGLVVSNPVAE